MDEASLLRLCGAESLDALWNSVARRSLYVAPNPDRLEAVVPGETHRVATAAAAALAGNVTLLGGTATLSSPIDWHTDFKTDTRWPVRYWRSIDYVDLNDESDVKVPWELSRLQWLLPAGQAYALTGDEAYAAHVRKVLDGWIATNPFSRSVNWAVTMEVALRVLSWTWLIGAIGASGTWADVAFRFRLLRSLYLHGDFTARNLERSDVNGNHYTADAVGLHAAGLVLDVPRWRDYGWQILQEELPRQVWPDGVDFEASASYHRLVAELFFLAALHRERLGLDVPDTYRERIRAMAAFTAAYTRPDGCAPHWGDADDARALPLGGADVNDHRHFIGAVASAWDDDELRKYFSGSRAEVAWLIGVDAAATLPGEVSLLGPQKFPDGGVYILREGDDYVFIDCGPVGLAGRGGHGHNDCLSFEATLAGVRLVTDCGSFVYTADPVWRNRFRSTEFHNTPKLDGVEQNQLDPADLWRLGANAVPSAHEWSIDGAELVFEGSHAGYQRLREPVTPVRRFMLDPRKHVLRILDRFEGSGDHDVAVALHLAPGVAAAVDERGAVELSTCDRRFGLRWSDESEWPLAVGSGWFSPSYGVKEKIVRLEWRRRGPLRPLEIVIALTLESKG